MVELVIRPICDKLSGLQGSGTHSDVTHQGACVSGVSGSVVQEARQAKIGDLADQVAVHQDISGGEVSVHVIHVRQVLHPCGDAAQHPHQLRHCEAPVVQLPERGRVGRELYACVEGRVNATEAT